jgi:phosphoribosylformimino-5-aminoimidazole carboxamide ribotide isomerase
MELYPAIDILDGRCVRLYQGDYERADVYRDDPVGQARQYVDQGATWIHVVDLDAARTGQPRNRALIPGIVDAVEARVQVGGGIRDDASAETLLAAGVARVVVGTAAVRDPDWVAQLARRHPGRVAVGLDARGRDVAVEGWTQASGQDLITMARCFEDGGVEALVVTEIGRDGTLIGPDLDQLAAVLEATSVGVVASGGVGSLDDLRALQGLRAGERGVAGAIVGRALYEGTFTLREALGVLSAPDPDPQAAPRP